MKNLKLSNSTYDKLKKSTQLVLPALGSLYFGLANIWHFPAGEEVVGTIALLTTFSGVVLGISSKNYDPDTDVDGSIVVEKTETGKLFRLELNGDPNDLQHQQNVTFKVNDPITGENEAFWNRPFDLERPAEHDRPAG